ncbi:hypothetical protein GCM10027060_24370 [Nesterenkonia halophila]
MPKVCSGDCPSSEASSFTTPWVAAVYWLKLCDELLPDPLEDEPLEESVDDSGTDSGAPSSSTRA